MSDKPVNVSHSSSPGQTLAYKRPINDAFNQTNWKQKNISSISCRFFLSLKFHSYYIKQHYPPAHCWPGGWMFLCLCWLQIYRNSLFIWGHYACKLKGHKLQIEMQFSGYFSTCTIDRLHLPNVHQVPYLVRITVPHIYSSCLISSSR